MTPLTREARLLKTFAMLADTLVDDYDIVDLLQSLVDACRDLLDITAAGILIADQNGDLDRESFMTKVVNGKQQVVTTLPPASAK